MKHLYLSLTFFFSLSILYAHKGTIKGAVYDANTNTPLPGATVVIKNTEKGVTTDALGTYVFSDLDKGEYTLEFSYVGYQKKEVLKVKVREDETTVIQTKLEQKQVELEAVTVSTQNQNDNAISKLDIQQRPINSSQDVLKIVPGLVIAQHAGGGKAEQIFLRGFDIDHGTDINLTVDGMPVNMVSHAHGQGYADMHFLIPEIIQEVEFNKGPYYADKGNFTTAGYVGFKTKDAVENSMVKLEAGQFDTYRGLGVFDLLGDKLKEKHQNAYIAADFLQTDGYFDSPQSLSRINLLAKYSGLISDNAFLSVSAATFNSEWNASGQIPERKVNDGTISRFSAIDDTEGGNTNRSHISVQMNSMLENGGTLRNQLYFIDYGFELYSNFTFFLNDSANGDQIKQKENRSVIGYNGSYEKRTRLFNKTLRSKIGGGFRYDDVNNSTLANTKNRKTIINEISKGDIEETNAFVYAEERFNITPSFTITAGVRFDVFKFEHLNKLDSVYNPQTLTENITSPKLSLNYSFSNSVALFAHAGYGFHSNDARLVLANTQGRTILPKALGTEVGTKIKPFPKMFVSTSLWSLQLEDELVYVGDEGVVEPSGRTSRVGVDFSLRYKVAKWLSADADVAFAKPELEEAPENENNVPLAPTLTSAGGITIYPFKGFVTSIRYRYLLDRPANEDNTLTAEGYSLIDLTARYNKANYFIGLSIENLLDQEWKEAQFETTSQLRNEDVPVTEIHFTSGTPFFLKASVGYKF